ncbi:MAG: GNAT family N-acetyltransferase [Cyanobacteria bacterium P01_D01_bin.44]
MNYETRPATEADYPFCYELTKQNMFDLFTRHWGGWVSSAFRNDFNAKNTEIITLDGQRVGYFSLKENDNEFHLDNIQLSPNLHGKGIGTAILENILHNKASKPILLTTFLDNPAIRLYERLGFTVTDQDGETVHMVRDMQQFY